MRSHALPFDASAPASVHVEIVCRSLLDPSLRELSRAHLSDAECWGIGLAVCDVCFFLSDVVQEQAAWRTAALRTIGSGLRSYCRWRDSGLLAANIVRHFDESGSPRWAASEISLLGGLWLAAATCRLRMGYYEYDAVIPQNDDALEAAVELAETARMR